MKWFKTILMAVGGFVLFHTIFYALEQVHMTYCVPRGVSGYFQSMLLSNSPMCTNIRWISTMVNTSTIQILYVCATLFLGAIGNCYSIVFNTNNFPNNQKQKI